VLIIKAVVSPSENSVPIRIANSVTPVSLYHGTRVTTAELLFEASISTVIESLFMMSIL